MGLRTNNRSDLALLSRVSERSAYQCIATWSPALISLSCTILLMAALIIHSTLNPIDLRTLSSQLQLPPSAYGWILVLAASCMAGALNSIAGGGSLITFPALLAMGVPPLVANASNSLALVPGSLASAYCYRNNLREIAGSIALFTIPGMVGGFIGAQLLLMGGDVLFKRLIPWLILLAASLILLRNYVGEKEPRNKPYCISDHRKLKKISMRLLLVIAMVFVVAIYGGYFGAGGGFLTLAALGLAGFNNIHQMNGLRNILSATWNAVATMLFIVAGQVDWLAAGVIMAGMVFGGVYGARLALEVGQHRARQLVLIIGFSGAAWAFLHH